MNLETADSKETSPTEQRIDEVLRQLDGTSDLYAILSIDEMTYMQTSGSAESGFILEYQAGSLDQHFTASDDTIPLDRITDAFKSYLRQDDKWKTAFEW